MAEAQYEALLAEKETLEDQVAARDADDGSRIPHGGGVDHHVGQVPDRRGFEPISASVRDLAARTGIATGCLSEIERRRKPGSAAALSRIAGALGTTIDALVTLR